MAAAAVAAARAAVAARAAMKAAAIAAARHRGAAAAERRRVISTTTYRSKAGQSSANQPVLQSKQKWGRYMNGRIIDALRRPGFSRRDFNRMLASAGLSVAAMPLLPKPGA